MAILQMYSLGTLDIRYDGQQVPKPPTLKSQSLLAYLAFHRGRPQSRERLAGLFWGDRPERKARRSLTTALWHIRRILPGGGSILSDTQVVQIAPQTELWLDADEFELLVSRPDASSLRQAVALYHGHLLEGFYDDWILPERYRLELLFEETLAQLMVALETRAEYGAALATAQRLLHHDPLREDAHRAASRAYYQLGQRSAALEQYHRCQRVLKEELDIDPMLETSKLCEGILDGSLEMWPTPRGIAADEELAVLPLALGRNPLDAVVPGSLVGREEELAFLDGCWRSAGTGWTPLVLISGEARVGKTQLVKEFANRLRGQTERVLWGRCYEFERTLPYQPIVEALRAALTKLTPAEVSGFPDWIFIELARLVPELTEVRSGLELSPVADSSQEQRRLFESIVRFLAGLASHGSLLLVLEDLHWASESTLQLLHYLARHLADHTVLMVGTSRPEVTDSQHPILTLRRRWTREGLAKDLHLSRLSPQAVEALAVEMSGAGEAVVPLVGRLYRETEGNALPRQKDNSVDRSDRSNVELGSRVRPVVRNHRLSSPTRRTRGCCRYVPKKKGHMSPVFGTWAWYDGLACVRIRTRVGSFWLGGAYWRIGAISVGAKGDAPAPSTHCSSP